MHTPQQVLQPGLSYQLSCLYCCHVQLSVWLSVLYTAVSSTQLLLACIHSSSRVLGLLPPTKIQVIRNTYVLDTMKSGCSFHFPGLQESV